MALFTWLFGKRHFIRRAARRIVPSYLGTGKIGTNLGIVRLSYYLIARRIPVVSGLSRRLVAISLSSVLSMQLAAGNVADALVLARLINLAFRPLIRARAFPITILYCQALFHCRSYHRIVAEFAPDEDIKQQYLNYIVGVSYLYCGNPDVAVRFLNKAIGLNGQYSLGYRMLGRAHLMLGDESTAAKCFTQAAVIAPNTVMAHQNYAGRYDIANYKPKEWELQQSGRLMIYDNYGQLAEDFFLLGKLDVSHRFYQKLLDYQRTLYAPLPAALIERLAALDPRFDRAKPVRLMPYEWVTQFGHIGLLASYIKMAKLGMYPDANYVLLAPAKMVSGKVYLGYWDAYFTIVRDDDLVGELFPFQRMIGDNFMVCDGTNGRAEFWTRMAAIAQIAWANEGRPPLLTIADSHREIGRNALRKLGVPDGAWYVGLHVREGGYYSEPVGGMSTHRNARIEDYIPALKAVTARGGYVIRLGDSTMRPLPKMPGVIDYALSDSKSAECDIFFCATSRFVIGTTSGLTTACLSFGTPTVLVNCISNDWQLWTRDTDFIVKPVWDLRDKRYLTLAETYRPPVQGYLINSHVMRRHGLESVANSSADITEAVVYKLDLLDGIGRRDEDNETMKLYRAAMAENPMMFGAASPVLPFLQEHSYLLN